MEQSFNKILFLTSFCCMAIDGEIAKEELQVLHDFADKQKLFGNLDIDEEYQKCLTVLNQTGADFVKSYLQAVKKMTLTDEEKYKLLDVTVKTIYADEIVEYNEIKFFKSLCGQLDLSKENILENVENVEDYWLEEDLASNSMSLDYLSNINFAQIDGNLAEIKEDRIR